ncbi:MAG TPA: DUF507 domain-containing protein [Myxococcales bacterium]|nr:DUF507 domain-containing protein [Myxococcales bacterium]
MAAAKTGGWPHLSRPPRFRDIMVRPLAGLRWRHCHKEDSMHLYRKIIPKIAHDCIRGLRLNEYVEIEDIQVIEAELDLATTMVEYMNNEDRISQEARSGLQRRHLPADRYAMVKRSIAEVREFPLGEAGVNFVAGKVLEALFDSDNVEEIYGSDEELRTIIDEVLAKHLTVDEEIDRNVRAALRNKREGSYEFETEYNRRVRELTRRAAQAAQPRY